MVILPMNAVSVTSRIVTFSPVTVAKGAFVLSNISKVPFSMNTFPAETAGGFGAAETVTGGGSAGCGATGCGASGAIAGEFAGRNTSGALTIGCAPAIAGSAAALRWMPHLPAAS